jgi:TRAP-type C4-dicarboxylate transport system substrate-binding protein
MTLPRIVKTCALAAAVVLSASAAQAQTVELKLSHFVPPQHVFHKWATAWAEEVGKRSDGRLKITIYPNGQLAGPPNRQLDAARNGIVDIAYVLHGATPERYSLTEIASLPFTDPSAGRSSEIKSKRLTELAPEFLAKEHEGLQLLWMAVAPAVVFQSKVPIKKLEDFKGLKVRYSGKPNQQMLTQLGAAPLLIQPNEAQDAMSKGVVDATMFPYEAAVAYHLAEVAKYIIEPPVSAATFAFAMNKAKYDSLPADLKKIIDETTGVAGAVQYAKMWDEWEAGGKAKVQKDGMQLFVLPDDEIAKLKKITAPIVDENVAAVEKQGKPARKFLEAYTK